MGKKKNLRRWIRSSVLAVLLLLLFCAGDIAARLGPLWQGAPPVYAPGEAAAQVMLQEGDYLLLGRYLDAPILWRVIAVTEGQPLLFSEYILCYKAFAAGENPYEARSAWRSSALRQWLNSRGTVAWAGVPPTAEYLYEGRNAYAGEPGFLTGFTAAECALIAPGEDQVFFLSKAQLQGLPAAQRRRRIHPGALAQDDSPYLSLRAYGWYWTADPIATNTQSVCAVTGKGSFYKSLACDGMMGVCPALCLGAQGLRAAGAGSKAAPYRLEGG